MAPKQSTKIGKMMKRMLKIESAVGLMEERQSYVRRRSNTRSRTKRSREDAGPSTPHFNIGIDIGTCVSESLSESEEFGEVRLGAEPDSSSDGELVEDETRSPWNAIDSDGEVHPVPSTVG